MRRSQSILIRLTSLVLLAWFPLLAVLPWIGLPGARHAIDGRAERFPCEAHRCGCEGVATCWDACCCFSPLEMTAWALHAGVPLPPGMEEYATLIPPVATESACCTVAEDDGPEGMARSESSCRTLLAAPADPFACKGVALGLSLPLPGLVDGDAALDLPVPRIAHYSAIPESHILPALFLEQPDPPPRRSSIS